MLTQEQIEELVVSTGCCLAKKNAELIKEEDAGFADECCLNEVLQLYTSYDALRHFVPVGGLLFTYQDGEVPEFEAYEENIPSTVRIYTDTVTINGVVGINSGTFLGTGTLELTINGELIGSLFGTFNSALELAQGYFDLVDNAAAVYFLEYTAAVIGINSFSITSAEIENQFVTNPLFNNVGAWRNGYEVDARFIRQYDVGFCNYYAQYATNTFDFASLSLIGASVNGSFIPCSAGNVPLSNNYPYGSSQYTSGVQYQLDVTFSFRAGFNIYTVDTDTPGVVFVIFQIFDFGQPINFIRIGNGVDPPIDLVPSVSECGTGEITGTYTTKSDTTELDGGVYRIGPGKCVYSCVVGGLGRIYSDKISIDGTEYNINGYFFDLPPAVENALNNLGLGTWTVTDLGDEFYQIDRITYDETVPQAISIRVDVQVEHVRPFEMTACLVPNLINEYQTDETACFTDPTDFESRIKKECGCTQPVTGSMPVTSNFKNVYYGRSSNPALNASQIANLTAVSQLNLAGTYDFPAQTGTYCYTARPQSFGYPSAVIDPLTSFPIDLDTPYIVVILGENYIVDRSTNILNGDISFKYIQ